MNARPRDPRSLYVLATAHASVDFTAGVVVALLPFFVESRGYSYTQATSLLLVSAVMSSIVQPLFGLWTDARSRPWLMTAGVLVAGAGIGCAGLAPSYALTLLAVGVAGLGVAAFHPEAARHVDRVSGSASTLGMSVFSVGGNVGAALGPALGTPLLLLLGFEGTVVLALPIAVAAVVLARTIAGRDAARRQVGPAPAVNAGEDQWGPFGRLTGVVALRSALGYALQAFVPLWFVQHLGLSEAAGNGALTTMLVAAVSGTLIGGVVADRIGRRPVLLLSMAVPLPMTVLFIIAGPAVATVALIAIGLFSISTFSVTVVMGQEYLPGRVGLASGVILGLAIGVGGAGALLFGVLADHVGLTTTMWTIALLPIAGVLLSLTLPDTSVRRGARHLQWEETYA